MSGTFKMSEIVSILMTSLFFVFLQNSTLTESKGTDTSQQADTSSNRVTRGTDKGVSVSPDFREGVPVLISELGTAKDMNKDVSEKILALCELVFVYTDVHL